MLQQLANSDWFKYKLIVICGRLKNSTYHKSNFCFWRFVNCAIVCVYKCVCVLTNQSIWEQITDVCVCVCLLRKSDPWKFACALFSTLRPASIRVIFTCNVRSLLIIPIPFTWPRDTPHYYWQLSYILRNKTIQRCCYYFVSFYFVIAVKMNGLVCTCRRAYFGIKVS